MPLGKNIKYVYRDLPKKNRHQRRQRLAFDTQGTKTRKDDRVVEVRTEEKRNGNWFGKTKILGSSKARGHTRQL